MSSPSNEEILKFLNEKIPIESNRRVIEFTYKLSSDSASIIESKLSLDELKRYEEDRGDVPRCEEESTLAFSVKDSFVNSILDFFNKDGLHFFCTNHLWYPPGGWMGWHTNSHNPRERIYLSWAEEDRKSFFRYRDVETKKLVTNWEKKGWNINRFVIPEKDLFWHCVGSFTNRLSVGVSAIRMTDMVRVRRK